MASKTVIEAIREAMDEEMERDPSVFIIGEDVGIRGGVFLATDGLYKKYGEDRVIDSPLAESCIVGVASRRCRQWDAADCGDPVRGLHRARHEPDHRGGGPLLLPHGG